MRIDHVRWRFQQLRWGGLLVAVAIPVIVWIITRKILDLEISTVSLAVAGSLFVSFVVLHLLRKYLDQGFAESYVDKPSWNSLTTNYGVDQKPHAFSVEWSGSAQLDRDDVVFVMDAGLDESHIYLNIQALGRLIIPWSDISYLRRTREPTNDGGEQRVFVTLSDDDVRLMVTWDDNLDAFVPKHVGVGP